jgi:hypothetical protein
MKRVSFALMITLLLSFGLSYGMDIWAEFTGPAVWDDMGTPTLNVNSNFDVTIYAENGTDPADPLRLGWSSPFVFTGSGNVTTLNSESFTRLAPFDAIWSMGIFESQESWDLNLTNNDGGLTGDQYNYSGISMDGMAADNTVWTCFYFTFNIAGDGSTAGNFCIDQGDFVDDTYDWLFEDPVPTFNAKAPMCMPVKLLPNLPPVFTDCPGVTQTMQWNEVLIIDLATDDNEGDPTTAVDCDLGTATITDPGNPGTVRFEYNPTCADVGSHTATLALYDAFGGPGAACVIDIDVLNTDPVIGGDCGESITVGTGATKTAQFTVTDVNDGTADKTWSISGMSPGAPDGAVGIDANGLLTFSPTTADDGVCYVFTVRVTDCAGAYDECDVEFCVISELPFEILIEKVHNQLQGRHGYLNVIKVEGSEEMWGFDLLIGYDQSALALMGVIPGPLFEIPGMYEWEYITWRYNWNGNCGNGCPSGVVRVVGMADQNDGAHHPVSVLVANGTVLFTLDFLISNDRNLGCMYVPVNFWWVDCGDNAIAFRYRSDAPLLRIYTALSMAVYFYCCDPTTTPYPHYCEVTDMFWGFPTYYGAQWECFECADPQIPEKCPIPFVKFFGGGFDIICPDSIDARGDVNLNGISNEIADAVVFTNYFIYHLAAFTVNIEGQIAATEINGDGAPLTVADLVYLIRIIVGDAMPLPKIAPNISVDVVDSKSAVTINNEIGAGLFVFAGNVDVSLADGAAGFEMKSDVVEGNTRVLLYTFQKDLVASGTVLNANGNLISVEAADYNGNVMSANIVPAEFSLTNYPNPFNPVTNVEMSLPVASQWTLSIYNVAGQKVAEFDGYNEAGIVSVEWDATGLASGIYFYKATAGKFSATKKMALIK